MQRPECPATWLAEAPTLPELPRCGLCQMPPAEDCDLVLAAYRQHVDRTLLRENLKLTPAQRAEKFVAFMRFVGELRGAGARPRPSTP